MSAPPIPSNPAAAPATIARRVPPPCWTHEETIALIDSYHEKWYSLRRGNLRASHWQEVAESVARRCRFDSLSKTSVQCRHKIEKLRKRYRTEKQRLSSLTTPPNHRYSSSWVYFKKLDLMEKGPSTVDSDDQDDDDEEDDDEEDNDHVSYNSTNNHHHRLIINGSSAASAGGFRFRIPSGSRSVPVQPPTGKTKTFVRVDENPNPNPRYLNSCSVSRLGMGRNDGGGGSGGKREMEMDPVSEMVSSIRMLGEGFVKMEQMKIEMAREMEQMRMEMEMKRTEMILESQQRIVEAFAKGFSGKKKLKRMPSPES